MESYRLFGVRLDSEHRFRVPLPPGSGDAQLTLEHADGPLPGPEDGRLLYRSPLRTPEGDSVSRLYAVEGGELFVFPPDGRFLLLGDRILCPRPGRGQAALLEIRFLGAVMAYWLERRGVLAVHASAVEVDSRAVAFVAAHGGGKTSLAATFAAAGHRLLTDDLLALDPGTGSGRARAGYPALRMDPIQLDRFRLDRSSLRRVHPQAPKWFVPLDLLGGAFQPVSLPLAAIFLPRRAPGRREVAVSQLSGAAPVIELVRCSFSPYVVEAVGLQPGRLDRLAQLAQEVAVRRLDLPEGLDRLEAARQAVLEEVATLPMGAPSAGGAGVR